MASQNSIYQKQFNRLLSRERSRRPIKVSPQFNKDDTHFCALFFTIFTNYIFSATSLSLLQTKEKK